MRIRALLFLGMALFIASCKTLNVREDIVSIPVTGTDISLAATVFRPNGNGPFPLIVLSHGEPTDASKRVDYGYWRQPYLIDALVSRGFAIVVPVRRGFGATGGKYVGGFGGCSSSQPRFYEGSLRTAEDILAAMQYASGLPFVDKNKIILMGQSAGGIASLAAASTKPNGLVMVANFSGGRGGRPDKTPGVPCHADAMAEAVGMYAKSINVPVLWHYVEDDRFFSPAVARVWFSAFEKNGGTGKLVVQPPFGPRAHTILIEEDGAPIWGKAFDEFLREFDIAVPISSPKGENRVYNRK